MAATRAMVEEWIAGRSAVGVGYWAVRPACAREAFGVGGVRAGTVDGTAVFNLYYRFAPHAWGHGYATEVTRAALDIARRVDPARPVVAIVHPDNLASQRVAHRAGLVAVGEIAHNGGIRLLFRTAQHPPASPVTVGPTARSTGRRRPPPVLQRGSRSKGAVKDLVGAVLPGRRR
ncbi:GNAT family N-acetyltransferase, partial [Streptomyces sp. URMC 123]|uniref:GNAT family N-acetyltransferase n=1 Tax=Streptomyces sp. URMC 123 TaxID=3423403 RepID=UPI003F1C0464